MSSAFSISKLMIPTVRRPLVLCSQSRILRIDVRIVLGLQSILVSSLCPRLLITSITSEDYHFVWHCGANGEFFGLMNEFFWLK